MIRLLQFLILGHVHFWQDECVTPLVEIGGSKIPIGRVAYCRCKTCGARKAFTMKA